MGLENPRVALVHDWLVTWRGGEKVLAALAELYPAAPIFTLFYDQKAMPPVVTRREIHVPPLLNALRRGRKALLPLLPHAIEAIDLEGYDLVLSTSSCVAHGAVKARGAKHLCYLHSPMRYIWDQQDEYLAGVAGIPGAAAAIRAMTPALRRWDVRTAQADRVDHFVVNSSFVGERARSYYGRESTVVAPPIETDRFAPARPPGERDGYVLAAGAMVSYKRFDLAIEAAAKAGKRLIVAGSGPMLPALRRLAVGKTTEIIESPDDATFVRLMQNASAFLFPGVEDFGMTAVEALACGTPVLAYREGGARDIVREGETGSYFREQTAEVLAEALTAFRPERFDAEHMRAFAKGFGKAFFLDKMRNEIKRVLAA